MNKDFRIYSIAHFGRKKDIKFGNKHSISYCYSIVENVSHRFAL